MMSLEQWQKGLDEWDRVRRQAEIDLELATAIMPVLQKKIDELTKQEVKENVK